MIKNFTMWFKYLYLLKISFVFSVYTSGWTWVHLLSSVCFTENLMAKLVEWKSVNRNADYQYYSHNVNRHWEARCEPVVFAAVNREWKLEQFVGSVLTLFLSLFHSFHTGAKMIRIVLSILYHLMYYCNFLCLHSKLWMIVNIQTLISENIMFDLIFINIFLFNTTYK